MINCIIPYFQNDNGYELVEIGVKDFVCIGASPPFDHPHIFLKMGMEQEIICPYCSTLYRLNTSLEDTESYPIGCRYVVSEFIEQTSAHNK